MLIFNGDHRTIPAFGVCRQAGQFQFSNGRRAITIQDVNIPPPSTGHCWLIVNGSAPLAPGAAGKGRLCVERPRGWVAYTGSTPALGELWGITDGGLTIEKDGAGFEIIGGATNGRVLANYIHNPKLYVRLSEDLEAATNLLTGRKTADAQVITPGSGFNFLLGSQTITVTNRWLDVDLSSGKHLWVEWSWLYLEWIIQSAECP